MDLSIFPSVALFIVTVFCAVATSLGRAICAKKSITKESELYLFNAVLSLLCMIVLVASAGFSVKGSWYTLLLGLAFGLCVMIGGVVQTKAVKIGPWSYTQVIICASTVFTALSGWAFWGETLGVFKIVGVFTMFLCCCFAVDKEEKSEKSVNLKWFLLCVVAMVITTLIGIMQKVHQSSVYKGELTAFLVVAFAVSTVSSFGGYFVYKAIEKGCVDEDAHAKSVNAWKWIVGVSAVCGIFNAGNNLINLYLAGAVDSAVMFPIVNGIPLVISVVLSFLLFKEKMTKKQWLGFALGIVSVACLCL